MTLTTLFAILSLVAVVATLFWGVGSMAHGGAYDREHSEQIMITRVGIQAAAVIMIVLAAYFSLS